MSISVLNTDAQISASTILTAEDAATITGLNTFDRDPNAPFAVAANSAVVSNLDADKLDGQEGAYYLSAANHTGEWTDVAFAAGNFTASGGGTWTVASGDQATFMHFKEGKKVTFCITINTSTIAGTVTQLNIAVPYTAVNTTATSCIIFDNHASNFEVGQAQISASAASVFILRAAGASFSASTDLTTIKLQITFETSV